MELKRLPTAKVLLARRLNGKDHGQHDQLLSPPPLEHLHIILNALDLWAQRRQEVKILPSASQIRGGIATSRQCVEDMVQRRPQLHRLHNQTTMAREKIWVSIVGHGRNRIGRRKRCKTTYFPTSYTPWRCLRKKCETCAARQSAFRGTMLRTAVRYARRPCQSTSLGRRFNADTQWRP